MPMKFPFEVEVSEAFNLPITQSNNLAYSVLLRASLPETASSNYNGVNRRIFQVENVTLRGMTTSVAPFTDILLDNKTTSNFATGTCNTFANVTKTVYVNQMKIQFQKIIFYKEKNFETSSCDDLSFDE
jgi:hypothetical protein